MTLLAVGILLGAVMFGIAMGWSAKRLPEAPPGAARPEAPKLTRLSPVVAAACYTLETRALCTAAYREAEDMVDALRKAGAL